MMMYLFLQAVDGIWCLEVTMLEALGFLSAPKRKVTTDPFYFKWKLDPGHKYA